MRKRNPIPDDERMEIIKNEYVYDVSATNVYFTEEGKRRIYGGRMDGMSPAKIFLGMGLPISGILGKRGRNIVNAIVSNYRKRGTFECKYGRKRRGEPAAWNASADKRVRELEEMLAVKEQELSFLKKITETAGSRR